MVCLLFVRFYTLLPEIIGKLFTFLQIITIIEQLLIIT